jgi:intracellular multiplication protein IcmJ
LLDITLQASETNWRLFMLRKTDAGFQKFQEKIHNADNHTCRFCGFQSLQNMDVVNIDHNYMNNKRSNLATCCMLCTQCFFIESVGQSDFGGGSLILLPEINQSQLNALCHVLFAQMAHSNAMLTSAKNIYRGLKLRSQFLEKQLGEGLSSPAIYGRVLVESRDKKAAELHKKMVETVRLLPAIEKFTLEIQSWSDSAMSALEA